MKIIHFIQIAHSTTIKFIKDLARLLPGQHLVVNQDPLAMKMWTIPDTDILVYKGLMLSEDLKNTIKPDLVINYTNTRQFCQWPNIIDISTGQPEENVLSTYMVDVANIPKSTHYLDPTKCKLVDLAKEDYDLTNVHVGFYVAQDGEHEPRRIIECMAAGAPVVANRTPETAQLVMNGVTGLLVAPDENVDDAITNLVGDPDVRYELGQAAVHWVEETADIQYVVDAIGKIHANNGRETNSA